ncbi:MAG: YerC/YecD family TrpR-related protein [Lachnospiraceae bacterium]
MNKKIKTEAVDHLFEAILTLKTPEECYIFFEDVCTVNELLSLSQRYEVAKMLREYSIENQMARGKALIEIKRKVIKLTKSYNHCEKGLNFLSGVFIIRNYKD